MTGVLESWQTVDTIPHSDLGFVVDRALWLKSFPAGAGTFTLVLVSDVFNNGQYSYLLKDSGVGYDILAAAGIYNQQMGDVNVTVGAYGFPYLHQNNVFMRWRSLVIIGMLTALGFTPVFLSLSLLLGVSPTKFRCLEGENLAYPALWSSFGEGAAGTGS